MAEKLWDLLIDLQRNKIFLLPDILRSLLWAQLWPRDPVRSRQPPQLRGSSPQPRHHQVPWIWGPRRPEIQWNSLRGTSPRTLVTGCSRTSGTESACLGAATCPGVLDGICQWPSEPAACRGESEVSAVLGKGQRDADLSSAACEGFASSSAYTAWTLNTALSKRLRN